jgi:WD40 repeat protein
MTKSYQLPIDTIGITVENKKHLWYRKKSNLTDKIISSSSDRTIRIWNLKSGECSTLKDHTSSVSCLYLNKLSNILYSGSFDGKKNIKYLKKF